MPKYLLFLLLLLCANNAIAQKTKGIKYFQGSLQDFEVAAKDERIPSLLYIHGENDAEQILYDNRIMADTAIVKLVDSSMIAYQVNTSEDYRPALKYLIEDSPVLIIFDKNGWEINRMYGYKKVYEIVDFLLEIYK